MSAVPPLDLEAPAHQWRWCKCQGTDPIAHKHYGDAPHRCARCSECKGFEGWPRPGYDDANLAALRDARQRVTELEHVSPEQAVEAIALALAEGFRKQGITTTDAAREIIARSEKQAEALAAAQQEAARHERNYLAWKATAEDAGRSLTIKGQELAAAVEREGRIKNALKFPGLDAGNADAIAYDIEKHGAITGIPASGASTFLREIAKELRALEAALSPTPPEAPQ